jgi:hypothetical protein
MTIQNKHEHNHNHQDWQFVAQKKNTSIKNKQRIHNPLRISKESMEEDFLLQQQIESICIPRVEQSLSKEYIYNVFDKLDVGIIESMTEIPLRNDSTHKRILLRIRWNTKNDLSYRLKEQLKNTGSIKVVHCMPWYWKIVSTHPQI